MPVMRDKQTGVIREVHPDYVKRWPNDYEPLPKSSEPTGSVKTATEAESNKSGGKRKESSHGEN